MIHFAYWTTLLAFTASVLLTILGLASALGWYLFLLGVLAGVIYLSLRLTISK